jgi:hypothetical protein
VTDWLAWHDAYDDASSPLAQRLDVVRTLIADALSRRVGERLRVVSACAGDGRDVLPVLERLPARATVDARLIELDPRLADRAWAFADAHGLENVEVVSGDASDPDAYAGAVPADLVVAAGILGNVSDADARRFVSTLPAMCEEHGAVLWTRHRRQPDLTVDIRRWFAEAGFAERAFVSPGEDSFAVGLHELLRAPGRRELARPLFTFVR